jgi:hypothetical protein
MVDEEKILGECHDSDSGFNYFTEDENLDSDQALCIKSSKEKDEWSRENTGGKEYASSGQLEKGINLDSTSGTAGIFPARLKDKSKGNWAEGVEEGSLVRLHSAHSFRKPSGKILSAEVLMPSLDQEVESKVVGYAGLEQDSKTDIAAREATEADIPNYEGLNKSFPKNKIISIDEYSIGEEVVCSGGKSGVVNGTIVSRKADLEVKYPRIGQLKLKDQIIARLDLRPGDSGAAVFTEEGGLLGQVCASNGDYCVVNKVKNIEEDLGVEILCKSINPSYGSSKKFEVTV